uniref:Uncharacterized protein n=1 Tax=Arundo donax TaxID=35708 RepID=A0A0A9HDM0_ARUDO
MLKLLLLDTYSPTHHVNDNKNKPTSNNTDLHKPQTIFFCEK